MPDSLPSVQSRALYASGTQFPGVVTPQGQSRTPSQANNCYVFPGLGQGCVDSGATRVTSSMLLAAASAIASEQVLQQSQDLQQLLSHRMPLQQLPQSISKQALLIKVRWQCCVRLSVAAQPSSQGESTVS